MKQYDALQREVGPWSVANFGDQESPFFLLKMEPFPPDWKVNHPMPPTMVCMGSLAPLMGIVEELGELAETKVTADLEDALGDVFVYLCDYCHREGFTLPIGRHLKFQLEPPNLDAFAGMIAYIGKLYHGCLKRHQGIRGFDNDETWEAHRNYCVAMLLVYMQKFADETLNERLLVIANKTWTNVVQKRDWKKSPTDGGGFDHYAN